MKKKKSQEKKSCTLTESGNTRRQNQRNEKSNKISGADRCKRGGRDKIPFCYSIEIAGIIREDLYNQRKHESRNKTKQLWIENKRYKDIWN